MLDRMDPLFKHLAAALASSMLMLAPDTGWSQVAPPLAMQPLSQQSLPDHPPPQSGSAPPSVPEESQGVFSGMGKMWEKSLSILPTLKSPGETFDDLNARAKDAGDALSRLAKPFSMVSGRMLCPVSANGAPDCKAGADRLCQSKGFREGSSPQRRFRRNLLAKTADAGSDAKGGSLPDGQLRYPGAVPVVGQYLPLKLVPVCTEPIEGMPVCTPLRGVVWTKL